MALNLTKGSKISLVKENGGVALSEILIGLGWDVDKKAGRVDLDASAILFDANKGVVDTVYFGAKASKCGSVKSNGDNVTGEGDGDDEVLSVFLDKVPAKVEHIVFAVTNYTGQPLTCVKSAYARVVNAKTNVELGRYSIGQGEAKTGIVMGRLYRHNGEWKYTVHGDFADGKTVQNLVEFAKKLF